MSLSPMEETCLGSRELLHQPHPTIKTHKNKYKYFTWNKNNQKSCTLFNLQNQTHFWRHPHLHTFMSSYVHKYIQPATSLTHILTTNQPETCTASQISFLFCLLSTSWQWMKMNVCPYRQQGGAVLLGSSAEMSKVLGANHGMRSDFMQPAAYITTDWINHAGSKCNFSFHLMVAAPLCNFAWQCHPCYDPYQLISVMATVDKKGKVDVEGCCFQERWKLQYFFTENQNNCIHLICRETVAMYEEFSGKGHYQTKDSKAHNKLSGSNRAEKVKQLEAVLASRQQ